MTSPSDRRRHPRVRLDANVVGRATVLADFRIAALSETGATLEMDLPLALGSECVLSANLSHVSVEVKGRVVHTEPMGEGKKGFLIGVDFEEMEPVDQGLILSFLERERRRSG